MDWSTVKTLLSVIHQASAAGPKFTKYAQAANDELEAMWADEYPPPEAVAPAATASDEATTSNGRRV